MLLAIVWLAIAGHYGLTDVAGPIAPVERAEAIEQVRAAIEGRVAAGASHATNWGGVLALLCRGRPTARRLVHSAAGRGIGELAAFAEDPDVRSLDAPARTACRIKLDVVVGRGPVMASGPLFPLSFIPGIDGVGLALDGT